MATASSAHSSISGALYGLLVCDALGGPVQFQDRGTFPRVTGLAPIPRFGQPAGAWSDDGSMALCLAQSLIDTCGRFSAEDVLRHWTAWLKRGHLSADKHAFDIGNGTRKALDLWAKLLPKPAHGARGKIVDVMDHPLDVVKGQTLVDKHLRRDEFSGNGSLMRTAPAALMHFQRPDRLIRVAREQSDLTHPAPACGDACAVYCMLLASIVDGIDKGQPPTKQHLAYKLRRADISNRELRELLAKRPDVEAWKTLGESDVPGGGYVLETLEAALWAFFTTDSFDEGALRVVNQGNDSDSTGAVYGGLAGAYYGLPSIREEWCTGLVKKGLCDEIIGHFTSLALQQAG